MALAPIEIPITLGDFEQVKAKLLELKKVADDATNPDAGKAHDEFMKLGDSILAVTKDFKEATKASKSFGDSLVENEEGMVEVSASISKFEDQLYAMALAGQAGTKEFDELRGKTADLKAIIIETDKEVDLLSENKGLGAIGGGLGQIGERLMALDFQGASKDAKILNNSMSSLGDIGKKSITGLVQTVGQLSKAFIKFGVALLANPIFLLTTAILAIVGAIVYFMNKLGLLKPILDAIGEVLGWIGEVIDWVVQSFNDLTDAIGLTDKAGEKFARKQLEHFEKFSDATDKALKKRVFALEEEMKIQQINGESTLDTELEKQKAIRKTAQVQAEQARIVLKLGKEKGVLDEEEIKALEEKIALNHELYEVANSEIKILGVKKEKEATDDLKKSEEERATKAKEARDRAKQYAEDRIKAERMIKDLTLEAMQEGKEKEIAIQNEKYARLIEDTKKNERLIGEEKKRLIEALTAEQVQREKEIRAKALEEEMAVFRQAKEIEKQAEVDFLNELEAVEEEYYNSKLSKDELEIQSVNDKYFRLIEIAQQYNLDTADLEAQRQEEITRIETEASEARIEAEKQRQQDLRDGILTIAGGATEGLMALNDLVADSQMKGLEKGSEAEQRAAKKKFEINKKLQIAQAVIQGVQAVLAAYASGSAIPVVGAVTGPLFAVLAGVATLANINKIKNAQFEGGGGGGASTGGAVPNISSAVSQATPSLELFGGANEFNNTSQEASAEKPTFDINVTTEISEHEITDKQNKVKSQELNATL